jgi:hypothetical protein
MAGVPQPPNAYLKINKIHCIGSKVMGVRHGDEHTYERQHNISTSSDNVLLLVMFITSKYRYISHRSLCEISRVDCALV